MKILIIEYRDITHPQAGGAELVLREVFQRIAAEGHAVDYLCNRYAGAPREEQRDGLRILRRGRQPYFNLLVPWVYRSELKANRYDLIIEGIDKLPFFMPWFERRVPVLCIVPHLFGSTVFREATPLIGAYVYALEHFIPRAYPRSLFSVLSQSTQDDLVRRGLPPGHIRVIRSGLTQTDYDAPVVKPASDHPVILYLGRLKRYKGIELGLAAVRDLRAKFPRIEYQIVGTGDYRAALERQTRALGLEGHVTFFNYVPHAQKRELLQRATLLLYTSPKEGWGLSAIEANACGTPVVASASPGLRESVVDGQTGFLVPHGNVAALVERMDRLLSDPALYDRMRQAAIRWAQTFTWERSVRETLALMEAAVAAHPRGA